jgi:hypothetical protein
MKTLLSKAAITAALTLGSASHLLALQLPFIVNQLPPSKSVGWNAAASLCQVLPGSAPSVVNRTTGSVTFAPNASGTISLACQVPSIGNGIRPQDINYLAFTFSSPKMEAGCQIAAFAEDRTANLVDGWSATATQEYNGVWTSSIPLLRVAPFALSHTHEIDIFMNRPASAGNACNPVAYGVFLENLPPSL